MPRLPPAWSKCITVAGDYVEKWQNIRYLVINCVILRTFWTPLVGMNDHSCCIYCMVIVGKTLILYLCCTDNFDCSWTRRMQRWRMWHMPFPQQQVTISWVPTLSSMLPWLLTKYSTSSHGSSVPVTSWKNHLTCVVMNATVTCTSL